MGNTRIAHGLASLALAGALTAAAGCSSSGSKSTAATTTTGAGGAVTTTTAAGVTTTAGGRKLVVLVTNDDGFNAPGIDAVVEALRALPDVEVHVVAPARNQSGTGGKTTPGTLTAHEAKTASGYPAVAVDGYPADTVRYALDTLHLSPDVVVSGVNFGQNVGPVIAVSGTVGAARAAAARGIPAIAASQGLGSPMDFPVTTRAVIAWITAHRASLHRDPGAKAGTIVNVNGPSCGTKGKVRGTIDLPPAPAGTPGLLGMQDCTSTKTPTNDVEALNEGYVVLDTIPLTDATTSGN